MPQSGGTFLAVSASDIDIPTHRRQGDTFHLQRSSNHRLVKSFSKVELKTAATHWKGLALDPDPEPVTCPDLMNGIQWPKHICVLSS